MSTSASTLPKRRPATRRKSRKKQTSIWIGGWPLILGIVITPLAMKAATLMALTGPDGLRLLYPWMLLPKLALLGIPDSVSDLLSQAAMYLQFPFYGLFAMAVHRWKGSIAAILQLTLLHALAVGLLLVAAHA